LSRGTECGTKLVRGSSGEAVSCDESRSGLGFLVAPRAPRAGFEPAAYCLGGTSERSPDAAGRGLMCGLAAPIVANCGPASPRVCRCWLPSWLPRYLVTLANVRMIERSIEPIVMKSRIRRSALSLASVMGPGCCHEEGTT